MILTILSCTFGELLADKYSKWRIWTSPQRFFTAKEKAIWRSMAMWVFEREEWVDLPGPAEWWPEDDKKIDRLGFGFSDQKYGHKEAFLLVTSKPDEFVKEAYSRVFPSIPAVSWVSLSRVVSLSDVVSPSRRILKYVYLLMR